MLIGIESRTFRSLTKIGSGRGYRGYRQLQLNIFDFKIKGINLILYCKFNVNSKFI